MAEKLENETCDLCGSEHVTVYVSPAQAGSDFDEPHFYGALPPIRRCEICYTTEIGNWLEYSKNHQGVPTEEKLGEVIACACNAVVRQILAKLKPEEYPG